LTFLKLKLDLHTHCYEATGYREPTMETVKKIIDRIRIRELDGIAITEHWNKEYGFKVKDMVEQFFDNEVLIIPGQEIDVRCQQEVELYLPNGSTFRFLAHPGYPSNPDSLENVQGIEIENDMHSWDIDKDEVRKLAEEHGLLLLSNSDAHSLSDIGRHYNEISLEELYARIK
jgi:PHP family Zn ribbon phosphoesterase